MGRQKQPNPITEGWSAYRKMVDTHMMTCYPHIKCLTHKECHLDSFYPGKVYRAMEMEKDEDGVLRMKKKG